MFRYEFPSLKIIVYKQIKILHAWVGVTLALLLLLSSTTGTLLIWKEQFVKVTTPQARVDFTPTPIALARIAEAVEAVFDNNNILNIQFATAEFPLTKVTLYDSNYAYVDVNGGIVNQWHMNERPEEWLYDLHHRLLLDNLGLTIIGLAAMALIVLVLLGVITFIPMRGHFSKGVFPASNARPELASSHRNLGIVLTIPLLLCLFTGALLAFSFQVEEFFLGDIRQTQEYSDAMAVGIDDIAGEGQGNWLRAMERSLVVFPGGIIRSSSAPNGISTYRIVGVQQIGAWNRNGLSKTYVDAEMGFMDLRIDAKKLPIIERLINIGQPLHTGNTGSFLYKLILTVCGAGMALLSAFGLMSFIKSKLKNV